MFMDAAAFNGDLSDWDVSAVTNMNQMFDNAAAFNGNLSRWKVGSVKSMFRTFHGAAAFNGGNLSGWDVGRVKSMLRTFHGAVAFDGDLSGWKRRRQGRTRPGAKYSVDGVSKLGRNYGGEKMYACPPFFTATSIV